MSENCTESCSSCMEDCAQRKGEKPDFSAKLNEHSSVKKVIGVISGKGGVGKSLITSMLAVTMNRKGYRTAVLDADITGPSIPKSFGIKTKAEASEIGLFPAKSKTGIEIMSINLLLENDTDPVVWRGPIISSTVKQFWSDVIWNDIDYMFIDMPPGTGDVALTVFQSIPIDGIIVVTSPQELVSMIVSKAVKMAGMMSVPILGLVENMSFFKCPDNGKEYKIFGDSHIEDVAKEHNLKVLAKLPIDPKYAAACDAGMIELFEGDVLDNIAKTLEGEETKNTIKIAVASNGDVVAQHFGHCENFNIFTAQNDKIINSESIPNPGHKPGFLPNFLNDLGINVIIASGMGSGAADIFNEKEIEVVVGASGNAATAADGYLQGKLKSSGAICTEHQH
ncbi:MAG: P-loop NTPase [Firmicutes bacterium]|nr:P-loop NTPase [Bacillota bacterium]